MLLPWPLVVAMGTILGAADASSSGLVVPVTLGLLALLSVGSTHGEDQSIIVYMLVDACC